MNTKRISTVVATIAALTIGSTSNAQDVLVGLHSPAYGVRIKANFPGLTGGWARGFYLVNESDTENFFGMGAKGTMTNGDSNFEYGWIGKNYNDSYMSFLDNGNVGIGTTSPTASLHIVGEGDGKELLRFDTERDWSFWQENSSSAAKLVLKPQGNSKEFIIRNSSNEMVAYFLGGTDVNKVQLIDDGITIIDNGNVGIGTGNPGGFKLAVNGTIRAKEVIVDTGWSDFVFEDSYRLRSLSEIESHIEEHGHLPDVPSAEVVESEGLSVGEAQKIMMQKIEELTLYVIDQNKRIDSQQKLIEIQQEEIEALRTN